MLEELESENMNLGRIDVKELQNNPDIIREKLDEKINLLLDKYGYGFQITSFHWGANGLLSAEVSIVKKPEEAEKH